jgi:hypothetical protein
MVRSRLRASLPAVHSSAGSRPGRPRVQTGRIDAH